LAAHSPASEVTILDRLAPKNAAVLFADVITFQFTPAPEADFPLEMNYRHI
jgi:hypothetical protein